MNNNNNNLQKLKKCYICDEDTNDYCKSIFQIQTKHSETLIYKFLENFLENKSLKSTLNYDENRNIICQKCLLKLDEYDLAIVTAQHIEYELTQLLIDTNEKYENENYFDQFIVNEEDGRTEDFSNNFILVDENYCDGNDFQQETVISDNNCDNVDDIEYQYIEEVIDDDFKVNVTDTSLQLPNNDKDNIKTVPLYTTSTTNKKIIEKKSETHVITNTTEIETEKLDVNNSKTSVKKSKTTNKYQNKPEKPKKKKLKKHKLNLNGPPFKCPHCLDEFQYKTDLFIHIKIHDDSQIICDICGKTFKSGFSLNSHIKLHENLTPFECDICSKKFKRRGALTQHMPIHTREVQYRCDKCGKEFIHHSSYRFHKKSHDNIRDKKCAVCGVGFHTNSHLKSHMLIHTGEKPHACPVCSKTFAKRWNMEAHYKSHQGIFRVLKTHNCAICNSGFTRPGKLRAHILSKHKIHPSFDQILLSLSRNLIRPKATETIKAVQSVITLPKTTIE